MDGEVTAFFPDPGKVLEIALVGRIERNPILYGPLFLVRGFPEDGLDQEIIDIIVMGVGQVNGLYRR
jgi:hypothetical protein